MQKHEDTVQNLNGNVMVGATIQVMVAFTNTPASIFADPAGHVPITLLLTDNLGQFGFYAPNGRYDIFAIINGNRVAHDSDVLMFDPEDDERITGGSGGSGGTGGTGAGMTPEVELVPVNATVTPNYAQGDNFYVKLTDASTKFLNPVNYPSGVDITVTLEQDETGARGVTFDSNYALPDAQPLILATQPGGLNMVSMHLTKGSIWLTDSTPDKSATSGYGLLTAIARIGSVTYFGMGGPTGAMTAVQDGQTIVVLRNGRSQEATGAIAAATANSLGKVFRVYGAPVGNGSEKRPLLQLGTTDYDTGQPNRPAYAKAILNFEGKGTVYVRDLRVTGARNVDNDARGICNNADAITMYLNNVEITDCNNGVENGNAGMVGNTTLTDVLIDRCGVGGPDASNSHGTGSSAGFTHSVYFGKNNAVVTMTRVTLSNSVDGDNLKCRTGTLIGNQVLCVGAQAGREFEIPNGGWVEMTNSTFWKNNNSGTGSLALVGGNGGPPNSVEGLDTTRPRKYKFVNCRFRSDYSISGAYAGRDAYLLCSLDPDVPVEFVDCLFEGDVTTNNHSDPSQQPIYNGTVTVNGIRYLPSAPPVFTLTGGPLGPLLTPGYQAIPMTPIVD